MSTACDYKCVSSWNSSHRGGGSGGREEDGDVVCSRGSKELSSASVPQDKLQLSPRGHEKQSELSPLPWTYLRL